jgi:hypothetical protein
MGVGAIAHENETERPWLEPLGRTTMLKTGYALALAALTTVLTSTLGAAAVTPQRLIPHSAYGLQLSVPKPWGVAYFQNCPTRAVGTLLIGAPAYLSNCAFIPAEANIISMQTRQSGMDFPGRSKRLVVHGIGVISYPAAAASSGATTWVVPSKHVVLTATGTGSSAVLRTLAVASSRAVPAPGMLRGSVYLIAQIRTPVTGPVSISRLGSHGTGSTTIQAYDAQFWDTFRPGNYLLTGHAGDAPCPPVSVTIQSGKTTDAPEIECQGE